MCTATMHNCCFAYLREDIKMIRYDCGISSKKVTVVVYHWKYMPWANRSVHGLDKWYRQTSGQVNSSRTGAFTEKWPKSGEIEHGFQARIFWKIPSGRTGLSF